MAVAMGGAFGAVLRFGVYSLISNLNFPFATMTVNIMGSFLMGVLIEGSALRWSFSPELRAMIVVGMLGSFTTFSTFSLDFMVLWERGRVFVAAAYALGSVALSIAALTLGLVIMRRIFLPSSGI